MSDPTIPLPVWTRPAADEVELLYRASALEGDGSRSLEAWVGSIVAERGIDDATAALFVHAARRANRTTEELNSWRDRAPASDARHVSLLIVPGALHRHHDDTGADGARFLRIGERLGLSATVLDVPSLDLVERNAARLAIWLAMAKSPVVVVSLCKGSVDVKVALATTGAAEVFRRVVGWLDFSGPLEGTPLLRLLSQRRLLYAAVRVQVALRRQPMRALLELADHSSAIATTNLVVPPWIRHIRVLGFPLRRHLTHRWSIRGHAGMAQLGPNDGGGVLLAPAVAATRELLPLWGTDHHLRPGWDIEPMLETLVRVMAARAH